MRLVAVLITFGALASCSDPRSDAKREAQSARRSAEATARSYGDEVADRAGRIKDSALDLGDRAVDRVTQAADLARQAKAELDKVYRTTTDYDLDITTAAASSAHAAKLTAMPHVTVSGVTVGYEEVFGVSTTGASRKRHFRATWRRGDRDVIVGYQTESRLDVAAFAALLPTLVPIVDRLL